MSTPQAETKIERVVESVESLALAIVANSIAVDDKSRRATFTDIQTARDESKQALRDFLTPTLRVVGQQ